MYGMDIKIPFEDIDIDRNQLTQSGRLIYSIVQGGEITYRGYWDHIMLYE
jgi:hypothetical protein